MFVNGLNRWPGGTADSSGGVHDEDRSGFMGQTSRVISQFEFDGVRIQIHLLPQIRLLIFAHVVVDQSDRHDQRNDLAPVLIDNVEQFPLICSLAFWYTALPLRF